MPDIQIHNSRAMNRVNADGSWNVHCYSCGQYCGRTFQRIQRALCEICQRAERGEAIPEEALRAYQAGKAENASAMAVSSIYIPPEDSPSVIGLPKKKFSFASLAGDMFNAVGRFALGSREREETGKTQKSAKIAQGKKRPRLFSNVNLGSMDDVDKTLKGKK